jgi:ERCC4-type nuclease
MIPFTASPNEHQTKRFRVRERIPEMVVAKKPLAAGDYIWEAHDKLIGVEVKWSIGDLTSSLKVQGEKSGTRLGIEIRKLTSCCDIGILLIPPLKDRGDGKLEYDRGAPVTDMGWEYRAVKGILSSVALYGIIIEEWDGDIAERLATWHFATTKREHEWIKQRGRPDFVTIDPLLTESIWMLCSVYGWGPETAKEALEVFGSVRAVVNAGDKELQKRVKGVGSKLAEHFEEVVTYTP